MSMWIRLKAAMLMAAVTLSALHLGGCANLNLNRVLELVAIGSIFD